MLRGVVSPVRLVISEFAPDLAADRFAREVETLATSLRLAVFCSEAASAIEIALAWAVLAAFVAKVWAFA
jgi:hypothetical protein